MKKADSMVDLLVQEYATVSVFAASDWNYILGDKEMTECPKHIKYMASKCLICIDEAVLAENKRVLDEISRKIDVLETSDGRVEAGILRERVDWLRLKGDIRK